MSINLQALILAQETGECDSSFFRRSIMHKRLLRLVYEMNVCYACFIMLIYFKSSDNFVVMNLSHAELLLKHVIISVYGNVAIGNPERHMRKASHCNSKQQKSSHAMITLRVHYCYVQSLTSLVSPEITCHNHSIIACSRHIYVWCCSSYASRSWWITQSTQHHRRGCNSSMSQCSYLGRPLIGSWALSTFISFCSSFLLQACSFHNHGYCFCDTKFDIIINVHHSSCKQNNENALP